MMNARLLPCPRNEARRCIGLWHRHHRPHVGELWATRAVVDGDTVAVVVVGRPVSPELEKQGAWEVTRLAVGPLAPRNTASHLLGCAWRHARDYGCRRLVSYTRIDEEGTCYLAAGWVPVSVVRGREHTTGNRQSRWLPGFFQSSTETIDRVRWEIGPDAAESRVDIRFERSRRRSQ